MRNPVRPSSCVTPPGTSNELDVQNEWGRKHTHIYMHRPYMCDRTYSSTYELCVPVTVLLQIHSLEESPAGRGHPPPPQDKTFCQTSCERLTFSLSFFSSFSNGLRLVKTGRTGTKLHIFAMLGNIRISIFKTIKDLHLLYSSMLYQSTVVDYTSYS